ncbi:hypothetical protein GCM10027093_61820 [Paraburkholderia jirisanensis]
MIALDAAWRDWLALNTQRGCSAESMLDSMLQAGIDAAIARTAIAAQIAGRNAAQQMAPQTQPVQSFGQAAVATAGQAAIAGGYEYDAAPVELRNVIRAHDRDIDVLMRCERPQLILFGNVLSDSECEQLIERSRDSLRRSTTVNTDDGSEDVIQNRTSEGLYYQRAEDAFIETLDRRFAALTNSPVENGEGLQILHYPVGAEYRPHFDFFPPWQAGSTLHTARGGQRVATLIVYLNDVPGGGATIFPDAGMAVEARRGHAVYFRYTNRAGQVDPLSLHGGAPVTAGDKWIATKWVRERAYV